MYDASSKFLSKLNKIIKVILFDYIDKKQQD